MNWYVFTLWTFDQQIVKMLVEKKDFLSNIFWNVFVCWVLINKFSGARCRSDVCFDSRSLCLVDLPEFCPKICPKFSYVFCCHVFWGWPFPDINANTVSPKNRAGWMCQETEVSGHPQVGNACIYATCTLIYQVCSVHSIFTLYTGIHMWYTTYIAGIHCVIAGCIYKYTYIYIDKKSYNYILYQIYLYNIYIYHMIYIYIYLHVPQYVW